jgi:hypothetical protein
MPKKPRVVYSVETLDEICKIIETSDKGLSTILQRDDFPSVSEFMRWLQDDSKPEVREYYARAKRIQMELFGDQIIQIADDSSNDTIITENGVAENHEFVNRSKLRIDTRKWLMSKLAPKKYGDKVQTEHSGEIKIIPMQVQVSNEEAKKDLDSLQG